MSPSPAAASAYIVPPLPYARLRFTLRATETSTLPPFKGSLLRGAFGHALRRAACAMGPEQPCETCRLRAVCVYTRVFETYVEGEPPPFLRGLPSAPRPYVFEPGTEALTFAPGAALPFDLLLVGRAIKHLPYVLLAVERMAAAGLGSRRHPFAMLRRALELAGLHIPGAAVDWTFRPLLDRASTVKVRASGLVWKDWQALQQPPKQENTGSLSGQRGLRWSHH